MINIRKATQQDLPEIMATIAIARQIMQKHGNHFQWINGYPSKELIEGNIAANICYICTNEQEEIVGTFCWLIGDDPTYSHIEYGEWLNSSPYGVIHRLATNGKVKGIASSCIKWCLAQHDNIRVDTHSDNQIMQLILEKHGFKRCGIIYVANGTPRIAYQYTT